MITNSTTGFLPVVAEYRSELILAGLCPHVAEELMFPLFQLGLTYLKFRNHLNMYGRDLSRMEETKAAAELEPIGIHCRRLLAKMMSEAMPRLPTLAMTAQMLTECAHLMTQLSADNMTCQEVFQVEISEDGSKFHISVNPTRWVTDASYHHQLSPLLHGKLDAFVKDLKFGFGRTDARKAIKQMVEHQRK